MTPPGPERPRPPRIPGPGELPSRPRHGSRCSAETPTPQEATGATPGAPTTGTPDEIAAVVPRAANPAKKRLVKRAVIVVSVVMVALAACVLATGLLVASWDSRDLQAYEQAEDLLSQPLDDATLMLGSAGVPEESRPETATRLATLERVQTSLTEARAAVDPIASDQDKADYLASLSRMGEATTRLQALEQDAADIDGLASEITSDLAMVAAPDSARQAAVKAVNEERWDDAASATETSTAGYEAALAVLKRLDSEHPDVGVADLVESVSLRLEAAQKASQVASLGAAGDEAAQRRAGSEYNVLIQKIRAASSSALVSDTVVALRDNIASAREKAVTEFEDAVRRHEDLADRILQAR